MIRAQACTGQRRLLASDGGRGSKMVRGAIALMRLGPSRTAWRGVVAASLLAAAGAALGPSAACAQARYPERPVRIIVPVGPGGVVDLATRIVSEKLGN